MLEQLKARTGPFEDGFDFLVGNPPYVRADEDSQAYLAYRRVLDQQEWFTTRHLKWDLYVPFVEQYQRLLSNDPQARCCLVTIESIKTAPYAQRLRELLAEKTTLLEVLFTEGLRLFEDASWQDNVVFCFSRGAPAEGHRVRRRVARERTAKGDLQMDPVDEPEQAAIDAEQVFRLRKQVALDLSKTVLWEEVCYVSKGMVLHSNERLEEGQVVRVDSRYEPADFGEELVKDLGKQGKRIQHTGFRREDLISDAKDALHPRPYLEPRELYRGGIGRLRWIEFGEHTRCPSRVSRPTFPELYDRPKILFGTFTGVAVDDGAQGAFLVVSHSLTLAILWHRLVDVENRSLAKARGALDEEGRFNSELSEEFSEWYLCALALSEPIQRWLHANKRSMKEHVYPDDIKAIPVKCLSAEDQEPFISLERERHGLWRELVGLEAEGFTMGEHVEVPVHHLAERFRQEHPGIEHLTLAQLPASVLEIEEGAYPLDLSRARSAKDEILVGRRVIARVGKSIEHKGEVASLIARFLADLPGTVADRQSLDALPRTEEGLRALAAHLKVQELGVRRRQSRIEEIQAEIDRRAWELYE
jgi:type I restriction enzyme M protein